MTAKYVSFFALIILFLSTGQALAQARVTTFGLQVRPIIPSELFNAGPVDETQDGLFAQFTPRFGHTLGMAIRHGFNKRFSLETGIHFVRRNYELELVHNDSGYIANDRFRWIAYEIPIQGLLYIRVNEKMYMNNAFGVALDMFPSDVNTFGDSHRHRTFRTSWVKGAIVANVGLEYRTESSGFLYFGASYHRLFRNMALSQVIFERELDTDIALITELTGSYFTIDLRYFFHEEPQKRKPKAN